MKLIKLNPPEKNIAKGFYILITNGQTTSTTLNEFTVETNQIDLLNRNTVDYTIL